MGRNRTERFSRFTVGAICTGLILLLCYFAYTKDIPWVNNPYEVEAVFSTAGNQLQPRAPVRIAGVEVGKVRKVEHGPGGTALVTMEVRDNGLPLHKDATARLDPRLFLEGNYVVELQPGSPSAPEMKSGGRIPLPQTKASVGLGEVVAALDRPTRDSFRILLDQYSSALAKGGAEALNRSFPEWQGAFRGLARTMSDFRGEKPHDLSGFIGSQAKVSGALADRREDLAGLITDFNRTARALAVRRGATAATIAGFAKTFSTARPALAEVNAALPPLRQFAVDVKPTLDAAPATLDAAQPFLRETNRLVAPNVLPALTRDLRPTTRTLAGIQQPLVRLFQLVDPVSRCVSNNIVPVLNSKVDDGALSTGQPVWQGLRFLSGTTSASQNFDANGPYLRLLFGGGDTILSPLTGAYKDFVSITGAPITGSTPSTDAARKIVFRPDVDCNTQPRPSLEAKTAAAPKSYRLRGASPIDPAAARKLLDRLRAGAKP